MCGEGGAGGRGTEGEGDRERERGRVNEGRELVEGWLVGGGEGVAEQEGAHAKAAAAAAV